LFGGRCIVDDFDECHEYDDTTAAEMTDVEIDKQVDKKKRPQNKRVFEDYMTWSAGMLTAYKEYMT